MGSDCVYLTPKIRSRWLSLYVFCVDDVFSLKWSLFLVLGRISTPHRTVWSGCCRLSHTDTVRACGMLLVILLFWMCFLVDLADHVSQTCQWGSMLRLVGPLPCTSQRNSRWLMLAEIDLILADILSGVFNRCQTVKVYCFVFIKMNNWFFH